MPGRLEFDEVANLVDPLTLLRVPVHILLRLPRLYALHAVGCAELQLFPFIRSNNSAYSAKVSVRGERRHELPAITSEEVDDSARQIRRREHLAKNNCRIWLRLRCKGDNYVAAHDHRRDLTHQTEQWIAVSSDYPDNPH